MRMSQAMLSQRRTPGFAGALGQIVGSLNETNDAARAAQMQREDMLAELQSQYSTGQMTREVAGERSAAELFKIYAAMNKGNKPLASTWDPLSQRYVSREDPMPTTNTVLVQGVTYTQYTDGTLRHRNPDNTTDIYSAEGVKLNGAPVGGAK